MTTIAANLECMGADRLVTYTPSFQGEPKIWIAKGAIWGAAGPNAKCLAFKAWTLSRGKRPAFNDLEEDEEGDKDVKLEVLQLTPGGLYLWVNGDLPDPVHEGVYAVGSGGGYAVGALAAGASLEDALRIAEKWDNGTRGPFDVIPLSSIKRKRG